MTLLRFPVGSGARSAYRSLRLPALPAGWITLVRRHLVVIDGMFATGLFVFAALHLAHVPTRPYMLGWVLQIGLLLPLAARRRAPLLAFAVIAAVAFGQWLTGVLLPAGDIALLIALYTVAAHSTPRRTAIAAGTLEVGVALATGEWAPPGGEIKTFVLLSGMTTAATVIGLNIRTRRAYLAALEDRAARLEHERDQQAQIIIAEERSRIARDVHDIVSHSLSVMVALTDGAAYALPTSPERAADAIGKSSDIGRQAIAEMQRILGVLRDPDVDRHPQPGLAELEDLLTEVRSAGLPVSLTVEGVPPLLASGAQLAIYRVIQEALTNTRKHAAAGTSARVRLRHGDGWTDLEVTDDGPAAAGAGDGSGGHGLAGMRERVAVYGGLLDTGPLETGGWRVHARFARLEGFL